MFSWIILNGNTSEWREKKNSLGHGGHELPNFFEISNFLKIKIIQDYS